jgi:uncharacterized protein YndB with AHSA1/START domain
VATVDRLTEAEPARVFAVLADGWSYPLWVVGATHMRSVDAGWPAVGSRLHHSVGVWPLDLEDRTEVLAVQPDRRLELRAHAWPGGTARVVIELIPEGGGTRVRMSESAESGPGRLVPRAVQDLLLWPRNVESLQRLGAVAENREGDARADPHR